jgi:hypothetical protein
VRSNDDEHPYYKAEPLGPVTFNSENEEKVLTSEGVIKILYFILNNNKL